MVMYEVFGGAAWVLFGAEKHAGFEVYNDLDGELVNLFRVVKFHLPELRREFDELYRLNSRELFFDSVSQLKSEGLTDIQRAARYLARCRMSFGGNGRNFRCEAQNFDSVFENMKKCAGRLKNVVVENQSYDRLIPHYDRKNSLFYLDPPYVGTEGFYDVSFAPEEHAKLRGILSEIKGKFVISYNDCEEIRELYRDYTVICVERENNLVQKPGAENAKYVIIFTV